MTELVLRIGFSLLVVLGLMWGLARVIRRPLGVGRHHGPLAVLNRQPLTRAAAVTIVRVGDRAMILGVTDQQVSLLGEADIEEFGKFDRHAHPRRDHLAVDEAWERGAGTLPAAHPVPVPGRLDGPLRTPAELADGGEQPAPPTNIWASTMDFLRDRTSRR